MSRIFLAILLSLFLAFILTQVYVFWGKHQQAAQAHEEAQIELQQAKKDEVELEKELEYLSNPENFEKELRLRFNYRTPGEEFIILVPPEASTGTVNN